MAAVDDADISIAANGDVRYTGDAHGGGSPVYHSALEFMRWLGGKQDNAIEIGDDLMSMDRPVSIDRSTDNIFKMRAPYNIDQTLAEHLYGGSIQQDGTDTLYSGLQIAVAGLQAEPSIIQDNAKLTPYWGTSLNPDVARGYAIQIMVLSRTGGVDIDNGVVRVESRTYGYQYRSASTLLGEGNAVAALGTIGNDAFNNTSIGTIAALTGIVNTEGYQLIDISNGAGSQPYYAQWDNGSNTPSDLYEWMKWASREGTSETLYGMSGALFRGATHEIDIDTNTGTFNAVEPVSWTGGTGQMLAIDSTTAGTKMWIQQLTGIAPTDGLVITGGTSSASAAVNTTVITRPLGVEVFAGAFYGAWLGAFGVGFNPGDLVVADSLIDLLGAVQSPPNNQSFVVSNLTVGETRLLVTESDGVAAPDTGINYDQFAISGAHTAGGTTITVSTTIPSDTPSTGNICADNGTSYDHMPYSSFTGAVFTLTGTIPNNISANADAWLAYIDKLATSTSESFTGTYLADRDLLVKARDGGVTPIKPFDSPATFSATGGAVAVIQNPDV